MPLLFTSPCHHESETEGWNMHYNNNGHFKREESTRHDKSVGVQIHSRSPQIKLTTMNHRGSDETFSHFFG
jgi:hypothetical protein